MDIKFSKNKADEFLKNLEKDYDVYAPIAFKNEGRYSHVDSIRYGKISSFNDVVTDKRSDYSAKEVLLPINHLYAVKINGNIIKKEVSVEKKKLIILRSCDLHAMLRIDNKFLKDDYYKKQRDLVKFMVMECATPFDTCYCVSSNTNIPKDYSIGVRFNKDSLLFKIHDDEFNKYLKEDTFEKEEFEMKFAKEDGVFVKIPKLENWDFIALDKIRHMDFFEEYKNRCIGCGSCNASCPTCTCLSTKEVPINNSDVIEIRRVWNGCQLVKGNAFKSGLTLKEIVPTRLRQRVLDKFYNPNTEHSEEQMCVGCGRCTSICPKLISFSNTITRVYEELKK